LVPGTALVFFESSTWYQMQQKISMPKNEIFEPLLIPKKAVYEFFP
jgi:hypothetical protein